MATENVGRVVQIIGPVVDVEFDKGVPAIYNAVRIHDDGSGGGVPIDVIAEVEQHLGENRVRCVEHAADRRHGARHEGGRHRRARSRCRWARARSAAC